MKNSISNLVTDKPSREKAEKRTTRRAKMSRPLRVRPSDHRDDHFEDLPVSVNASKDGIYFTSRVASYYPGMRVFVTFPYSSAHDPMNCEYVAQVLRVETTCNDVTFFKHHRRVEHRDGTWEMKLAPMKKSHNPIIYLISLWS